MPARSLHAEIITERDQAIFQFLYESKVATGAQIQHRCFPKIAPRTANNRLRRLTAAGWLNRSGYSENGRLKHIFWISDKAFRKYVEAKGVNDRRKQLKSDALDHDITLVDIRSRLETSSAVLQVLTENVLQSSYEHSRPEALQHMVELKSDVAVEFGGTDGHRLWVPLEYENSLKSIERCGEKLRNYYTRYRGLIVLLICRNETTLRRMHEVERTISKEYSPKMHFALLSDFLSGSGEMTFSMIDGTRYAFG